MGVGSRYSSGTPDCDNDEIGRIISFVTDGHAGRLNAEILTFALRDRYHDAVIDSIGIR